MKGCICHFTKWQIHPSISKGTNNVSLIYKMADTGVSAIVTRCWWYWPTVYDAGPALEKHWLNVSCLLARNVNQIPCPKITFLSDTRLNDSTFRYQYLWSACLTWLRKMDDIFALFPHLILFSCGIKHPDSSWSVVRNKIPELKCQPEIANAEIVIYNMRRANDPKL